MLRDLINQKFYVTSDAGETYTVKQFFFNPNVIQFSQNESYAFAIDKETDKVYLYFSILITYCYSYYGNKNNCLLLY